MTIVSDTTAFPWPADGEDAAIRAEPLIGRCLAGDAAAHAALYQKYATTIYRLTYSLLRHREDAEEVLQDTFEYAFRRLNQYDPEKAAFKTWLYSIAISRCRNKRRRKWLPHFSLSNLMQDESGRADLEICDVEAPQPEESAVLTAEKQRVWEALGALSDKLRETAVLRYYDGFSYVEIGAVLGIPAKTAESRMRLAHKALRALLEDDVK